MVLKSSISTEGSLWRHWFDFGLRVTKNTYFSCMAHTKQILLVTFCCTTAGIGASFRKHGHTDGRRMEGQTDVEVEIVI